MVGLVHLLTKPFNPKGNLPWIFIGRTEPEAPVLRPPDVKSQLIGEDSNAGKDWRQEEKGMTEDEMAGWHHQLSGHEILQASGDSEDREACHFAVHGAAKSQTWLNYWTTINNGPSNSAVIHIHGTHAIKSVSQA